MRFDEVHMHVLHICLRLQTSSHRMLLADNHTCRTYCDVCKQRRTYYLLLQTAREHAHIDKQYKPCNYK